jgi:hypothetical protein
MSAPISARARHLSLLSIALLLGGCTEGLATDASEGDGGAAPCAKAEGSGEPLARRLEGKVCRPVPDGGSDPRLGELRVDGCGLISFHVLGGFTGSESFFDDAVGKQVGWSGFSDQQEEQFCNDYTASTGHTPERDVTTCPERKAYACTGRGRDAQGVLLAPGTGCRAPGEAGCASCCWRRDVFFFPECSVMVAGAGGSYVLDTTPGSRCMPGCQPCADCSPADEAALKASPRPSACVCVDEPYIEREGSAACRAWCTQTVGPRSACPGLAR